MSTFTQTLQTKTTKKTSTMPSPATPSGQRTMETTSTNSQQPPITLASLQASLQDMMVKMQQSIDRNYEVLTGNLEEMKEDIKRMDERIGNIDDKIETIQGALSQNEQKIKEIDDKTEKIEVRLSATENKTTNININRDLEEAVLNLELERSAFYLRFQNVPEIKDENLSETMAEIIAGITNSTPQRALKEIDELYRVSTNYARRHKLAREVHVRFTKKIARDEVYSLARETTVSYREKEITVLKQIPRRVREKRKPYQFLTSRLNKHRISFRWLIPEGILITFLEKKYRINSVPEAREFFNLHIKEIEEQDSKDEVETEGGSRDELSTEELLVHPETVQTETNQPGDRDRQGVKTRSQTVVGRGK